MSTVTPSPNHCESQIAVQMTSDNKSRVQTKSEDPSLSPDFLKFMDQLLLEHAWDESDLTGGDFGDRFRTPLFDFVRNAMTWPKMRDLECTEALQWVQGWLGTRGRRWQDFSGLEEHSKEDADILFLRTWAEVKFPAGEDPLSLAYKLSLQKPVTLLKEHRISVRYVGFVGLLFHLHRFNEEHPTLKRANEGCIVLPCNKLDKILGVSHETIASYRKFAVDHGFLVQAKRHTFSRQRGKSEATEFRFLPERFNPETREELPVAGPSKGKTDETPKPEPKSNDDSGQALPEVLNPSRKKMPNYVIEPILREQVWPYYLNKVDRLPKLCSWTSNRQRMAILCFREALRLTQSKWNVSQAIQLMLHAIDNLAASDFHMGLHPKTGGEKYDDWEHVFGNVEKFKKWIGGKS